MGRPKKHSFLSIFGFFKSIFTIGVLTAFVMGISLIVKTISITDGSKMLAVLKPVLVVLHLDERQVGNVAGDFAQRLTQTGINESTQSSNQFPTATEDFKLAFLADSHGNYDNLGKALQDVKSLNISTVFFLGDYTNLGEMDDLKKAKSILDASNLDYFSLPGDHDLWKSTGPQNFIDAFGANYFSKTINGRKFVALDNSANYTVIGQEEMSWFTNELKDADFVLLSQPLYHPSFNVVMGIVNGQENQAVRFQALQLLKMIRESHVKAIVAADQHLSSQNIDPIRPSLSHVVVGALTEERNLQTPRFSVFKMLKDGSYKIEDVLLK